MFPFGAKLHARDPAKSLIFYYTFSSKAFLETIQTSTFKNRSLFFERESIVYVRQGSPFLINHTTILNKALSSKMF